MFPSGAATVQPQFVALLGRIGTALATEKGTVLVLGHTDNQPIKTVQFPSNYHLSAARAQAAKAILIRTMGNDFGGEERVSAEGRADGEPVASNATPEGREENRRIEIVLRRQG
jgi:type VI secretion system protein ImpK